VIGHQIIYRALLELGASVNLLPFTVYEKLPLRELRPTKIVLPLADKSTKLPHIMVEDVHIKVREFIFSIDFLLLDIESMPNVEFL